MSGEKNRFAIGLVLIASILLLPVSLSAQTSTAPNNDWSQVAAVETGSKLVVKLKNGETVEGKLSGVSDTAISLSVKNKSVEIKRDDVRTVHLLKSKSAAKATLIGLGVGAGAGAAVGAAARSNDRMFVVEDLDNAIHAGLTVMGAGAGALTGYLVGKSRSKRVLIYQTKP